MADVKNDGMIGVGEYDNKPEPQDATHDTVDDFNEDTFDLCAYDLFYAHKYFLVNLMIIFWKLKRLM